MDQIVGKLNKLINILGLDIAAAFVKLNLGLIIVNFGAGT
jgi:hypothetical protein